MTDRNTYRQRVATVRGRARAQLAAIRKERLARMRPGSDPRDDAVAAAWLADGAADRPWDGAQPPSGADGEAAGPTPGAGPSALRLVEEAPEHAAADEPVPAAPDQTPGEPGDPGPALAGDGPQALVAQDPPGEDLSVETAPEGEPAPVGAPLILAAEAPALPPETLAEASIETAPHRPVEDAASPPDDDADVTTGGQAEEPGPDAIGSSAEADDASPVDGDDRAVGGPAPAPPESCDAADGVEAAIAQVPTDEAHDPDECRPAAGEAMPSAVSGLPGEAVAAEPEGEAPIGPAGGPADEDPTDTNEEEASGHASRHDARDAPPAPMSGDCDRDHAVAAALPSASEPEGPVPPAAGDLPDIPGVGPGLVWMFESAGVRSLDDLARAEAQDLAARLGSISRLLDLDYFIAFAQSRTAPR